MNPKFQAALNSVIEFFSAPKQSREELETARLLAEDTARRVTAAAAKAKLEEAKTKRKAAKK